MPFIVDVLSVCAKVRLSIYSVFSMLKAIRVTQIINKKKSCNIYLSKVKT